MVSFHFANTILRYNGYFPHFDCHKFGMLSEFDKREILPCIVNNKIRRSLINIDPAKSQYIPGVSSRHIFEKFCNLKQRYRIDNLQYWFTV